MLTASRLKRAAVSALVFFAIYMSVDDLRRDGDVVHLLIVFGSAVVFATLSFFINVWVEKRRVRSFADIRREIREIARRPA